MQCHLSMTPTYIKGYILDSMSFYSILFFAFLNKLLLCVLDGSRDLVPIASKIDCDDLPPLDEDLEQYDASHRFGLQQTSFFEAVVFEAPPLFESRLQYPPEVLIQHNFEIMQALRMMEGLTDYITRLDLAPEQAKKLLSTTFGHMALNAIAGFGDSIGSVGRTFLSGISSVFGTIVSPLLSILAAVGVVLIFAIALIILTIICVDKCKKKKAAKEFELREKLRTQENASTERWAGRMSGP